MTDIQMIKGDTTIFDVIVEREEEVVDLTGAKAWFTAKWTTDDEDADAAIELDSVDNPSNVEITPVEGKIRITIPASLTAELPGRWLEYDVQIKESSNVITTVQRGKLELTKQVTIATS